MEYTRIYMSCALFSFRVVKFNCFELNIKSSDAKLKDFINQKYPTKTIYAE